MAASNILGATAALKEVASAVAHTHACAKPNGFLALLSDGER